MIACDVGVAASGDAFVAVDQGRTRLVIDDRAAPPGAFQLDAGIDITGQRERRRLLKAVAAADAFSFPAAQVATGMMGDAVYGNVLLLGYACQKGLLPASPEALERAIELNGAQVEANRTAFRIGRLAAHDPTAVDALLAPPTPAKRPEDQTLDELVARRSAMLVDYQDEVYAARYRVVVDAARQAEARLGGKQEAFSRAVALSLHQLMAYKDEYEVGRLYADGEFRRQLAQELDGGSKLKVYLAPPLLARRDATTGEPRKIAFGSWIFPVFAMLAKLKVLRGTAFDVFGLTAERRMERALARDYETLFLRLAAEVDAGRYDLAAEIATLPQSIRGYGHIKESAAKAAESQLAAKLEAWRSLPAQALVRRPEIA